MSQIESSSITAAASGLIDRIRSYGPVAVAFSGGVDSAVVAKAAHLAWGSSAVAVTAVSPSLSQSDRRTAALEAANIGIRHLEISTLEFERPEYRRNAGDRCYFCKDTLYLLTKGMLAELEAVCIVNGANTDDLGDHRPGMTAAADHDVRSPLIEQGINKETVRQIAHLWNLTVADKPAAPCLASRIAYGVEVTAERVDRVEQAEAFVKQITGLLEVRVRIEAGELARIEVPLSDLSMLTEPATRDAVVARLRELGFRSVTLDLEGFRSGNLNSMLPLVQLGARQPTGRRTTHQKADPTEK